MGNLKPKPPEPVDPIKYVKAVENVNLPLITPLPPPAELVGIKPKDSHELSDILKYYFLTYGGEIEKLNVFIKDPKIRLLVTLIAKSIKFVAKKFYKH